MFVFEYKMALSASPNSDLRYSSFGNTSTSRHPDDVPSRRYYPVNVYNTDSNSSERKLTFSECMRCVCCWKTSRKEEIINAQIEDRNSSLVRPLKKSYTMQKEVPKREPEIRETIPTLTVTRAIEDDISKSTTKLLLSSEKMSSSISLSMPKYQVKKKTPNSNKSADSPRNSAGNSRSSTLKSGEKVSFIHEILECRDSFLKSLEWFDNSLTRGKKCRAVKRDEWIELRNDSGTIDKTKLHGHQCSPFAFTYFPLHLIIRLFDLT